MDRRAVLLAAIVVPLVLLGGVSLVQRLKRTADLQRVASWAPSIRGAADEVGLDPAVLGGLVYAESRGIPDAVSATGALGLCQVLPSTAAEVARSLDLPERGSWSPEVNLRLGAHYLARQLERFGDLDLALLAYRLGPNAVAREVEAAGGRDSWLERLAAEPGSAWNWLEQVLWAARYLRERGVFRDPVPMVPDGGARPAVDG